MSEAQATDQGGSQSVVDRIAAQFGITDDQPEQAVEPVSQFSEQEEAPESDDVEVEWGEGRYRVPKALEEPISKARDYTQKTQQLADQRRLLEQTQQAMQISQMEQQFRSDVAQDVQNLSMLENYAQQLQSVDIRTLGTDEKLDHLYQLQAVERQRDSLKSSLEGKKGEFHKSLTAEIEKAKSLAKDVLQKQGVTPDSLPSLREYAKSVGYTDAAMDAIEMDARSMHIIHKAMRFDQLQASKDSAVQKATSPVVKPGSSNPMPAEVKQKLAFHKQMKTAKSSQEKSRLIEAWLSR